MTLTNKPLTKNIEPGRPAFNFQQYQAAGGYQSVAKALTFKPRDLMKLVQDSGLGGRGGAGFNTGLKWSFIPEPDGVRVTWSSTPMKWSQAPSRIVC